MTLPAASSPQSRAEGDRGEQNKYKKGIINKYWFVLKNSFTDLRIVKTGCLIVILKPQKAFLSCL